MQEWKFGRGKGTTNAKKYRRVCQWCGVGFPSARPDAETCCGKHRTAYSRWVKKHVRKFGTRPVRGLYPGEEKE